MSFRRIDLRGRAKISGDCSAQPRPELTWIPVTSLVIDDSYQRPLGKGNWRSIERIAKNFDWARFTPLLVAPLEEGRFAIIDGQHRSHAAALIGEKDVPAMIVPMSARDQAAAFAWVNGNVTNITAFHLYKAALAAGESWALDSLEAVEAAGCRLMVSNSSSAQKKPREIYAIGLIRRLVRADRGAIVTRGLNAIVRSETGAGNREHYTNSILDPWFGAIQDDPAFTRLDLDAFCRAHDLEDVRDRAAELRRGGGVYRGISNVELTRRSLVALLREFAGPTPTRVPPAPSRAMCHEHSQEAKIRELTGEKLIQVRPLVTPAVPAASIFDDPKPVIQQPSKAARLTAQAEALTRASKRKNTA